MWNGMRKRFVGIPRDKSLHKKKVHLDVSRGTF